MDTGVRDRSRSRSRGKPSRRLRLAWQRRLDDVEQLSNSKDSAAGTDAPTMCGSADTAMAQHSDAVAVPEAMHGSAESATAQEPVPAQECKDKPGDAAAPSSGASSAQGRGREQPAAPAAGPKKRRTSLEVHVQAFTEGRYAESLPDLRRLLHLVISNLSRVDQKKRATLGEKEATRMYLNALRTRVETAIGDAGRMRGQPQPEGLHQANFADLRRMEYHLAQAAQCARRIAERSEGLLHPWNLNAAAHELSEADRAIRFARWIGGECSAHS
uniref:Uncharacterized protein n=1 Tax=Alexandrium monilatum TaxID=311494 RepID=A0A7S4VIY9_9DINO